jgi:hypothetical protein
MASEQLVPTAGGTPGEPGGGGWRLHRDDHGVTACSGRVPVAHVEVREDDARVRLEFWVDERLPHEVCARLTSMAFEHPALSPQRPVSAAFPHRETGVLLEVRSHVAEASTRVAGATCLLDGRVR